MKADYSPDAVKALKPSLDVYTCARCGREFGSDRSDEEARAEAVALWGPEALKPGVVVVCDDCFKILAAPRLGVFF